MIGFPSQFLACASHILSLASAVKDHFPLLEGRIQA